LHKVGKLQQIPLAASSNKLHSIYRNFFLKYSTNEQKAIGKTVLSCLDYQRARGSCTKFKIPTPKASFLNLLSCQFYLIKPLELLILSNVATTLAQQNLRKIRSCISKWFKEHNNSS